MSKILIKKLEIACISSCTCATKTADIEYHYDRCVYRLHQESITRIKELEKFVTSFTHTET